MKREFAIFLMLLAGAITGVSQVILKTAARKRPGVILSYRVFCGYFLLFFTTVLSVIAYRGLELKMGPVLGSSSYLFVMVFSAFFLKEKISMRIVVGNLIIVCGIIVFSFK
jgi:drug/metabolite transporter (DMT)-like permease